MGIRLRKNLRIGYEDAEDDKAFLSECFVDCGYFKLLFDCDSPSKIVLGRTGSGKTALLNKMTEHENVIALEPESLSLNYLSNSTILNFFFNNGVNLAIFYKLLWRHVFAIELIKKRYDITNEEKKKSWLKTMWSILKKDKNKERALQYLEDWGEKFWDETESRIKETTKCIEDKLESCIGPSFKGVKAKISAGKSITEEEKTQIVNCGKKIINEIHLKELTEIFNLLNENVFTDKQNKYYICIDRLDEDWIDESLRYHLIRSLIDTVREFRKVKNVKIIIALRVDLIEKVFKETRISGHQEEKYRDMYLNLKWTKQQLKELIDKRVSYLFKHEYTKQQVRFKDILVDKIDGKDTFDYMLERTLFRPRELIEFLNECLIKAEGRSSITRSILSSAENEYSRKRLRSLADEWNSTYPTLYEATAILNNRSRRFKIGDIKNDEVEDFCLNFLVKVDTEKKKKDELTRFASKFADGVIPPDIFLTNVFKVFYRVGLVGLKTDAHSSLIWSHIDSPTIDSKTLDLKTHVEVHPAFWRVLGIRP